MGLNWLVKDSGSLENQIVKDMKIVQRSHTQMGDGMMCLAISENHGFVSIKNSVSNVWHGSDHPIMLDT